MNSFFTLNKKIADSNWFQSLIIAVIIAAGVLVGIQTYGNRVAGIAHILNALDLIILIIFTIEVFVKIFAEGKKPWRYFTDAWNVFDFIIVAVCYLAFVIPTLDASFIAVLRLARILRVFKLVTAIPKLQTLVGALLKSIPSMGYVGILLALLFYIYAAMSVFVFGGEFGNDPVHFGTLEDAMLSLFRVVTLEDWTDIMYINMHGCDHPIWGYAEAGKCLNPQPHGAMAAIFFVSFVLIGTMIVLNLFIGVIMNSMDEVKAEQEMDERTKRKDAGIGTLDDDIAIVRSQLDELKEQLNFISHRLGKEYSQTSDINKEDSEK